jgi:glutamine amidotransferase-like uncharacterized protein
MSLGRLLGTARRAIPLAAGSAGGSDESRPVALVYRGPASRPEGCAQAVAALLGASRWGFTVRYAGPDEETSLSERSLAGAALYAQPGGGSLAHGYRHLRRHRDQIRDYVGRGGRYLGFCLGGYLAGATPGFALLPGDTDQYLSSPGATVHDRGDTLIQVRWRGHDRELFFQDGPHFLLDKTADATVLGTYPSGAIAALVARFGAGRVGVVGPHPEATKDWFTDAHLPIRQTRDIGLELLDEVMT